MCIRDRCRYLTGLHKQTRYHRARASSIAPAVALLPLGGVPYHLHHTFITAKPERRTLLRIVVYCLKRAAQKMQKNCKRAPRSVFDTYLGRNRFTAT